MTDSVNGFSAYDQNNPVKKEFDNQDFLGLKVNQIQIQNQNPVNSQINSDFLSQIAKFGSNDEVGKTYDSLQKMTTSLQSNQALQASALVGRKVLIHSNNVQLDGLEEVSIAVHISLELSHLIAFIYAESGELIKTISLNQPDPGFFQFRWNGIGENKTKVQEGRYQVEVYAFHEDKKVELKPMIFANVDSVSIGQNGEGLKLNLAGIGLVSLDQVIQISI